MLFKIVLKNFKYNLNNYILFFLSEMMAITMLFSFLALKHSLSRGISDEIIRYIVGIEFNIATAIIIVISIFMMVFSMRYYVKIRIRDYSMFRTLGMKQAMILKTLLAEYAVGITLSLVLGLLLGNGVLFFWQKILQTVEKSYVIQMNVPLGIYRNTILLSMVVLIGAVFSVMVMIGDKNVSKLAEDKQKKEIRPKGKKWVSLVFAGIGLYVFGIYLYQKDVSKGIYRSMTIWMIAAFLILYFGLGLILEFMKNREKFYFRNILHLNQLYHQYSTNYLVMYALTLIHFLAIGYLAIQIAGCLPLAPEKIGYPYDVAWCTSENAQGFVDELETKYDASVNAYPMFAATGRNMLQHIAISADTYEALTGRTVSLKRDEMLYGIQYPAHFDEQSIEDLKNMTDIVHAGKYRDELETERDFHKQYNHNVFDAIKIKEFVVQPVTGYFSVDGWHSNVFVLSNAYFDENWKRIKQVPDEQNNLVLLNFPAAVRADAIAELKEYEEKEGLHNDASVITEPNLYIADGFIQSRTEQNTFNFVSRIIILAALVFSCIFTIGMKEFSALTTHRRQNDFFYCMGMERGKRRRAVRKEVQNTIRIPLVLGGSMGLIYAGCYQRTYQPLANGDDTFWKFWLLVIVLYIFVIFACTWLLSQYLVKKVEEETKHERH